MTITTLWRALSLGLLLIFVPAHAEARRHWDRSTVTAERSAGFAVKFDRHAIHSVGSEALVGERAARVRHRASKHVRSRTAYRHHHRRIALKDQSRIAADKPKPGTLGAYRKEIEKDSIAD